MPRTPKYCKHKATGQAVVKLAGHDFYLGVHGTAKSKAAYDRLIAEYLTAGRRISPRGGDLTVAELCDRFLEYARGYYISPNGAPSKHLGHFKAGIKLLVQLYADTLADEFGPVALETVRNAMIEKGWSRVYVNQQTQKIRSLFKWGVSKQLVPPETHQALVALAGLRAGKSTARESMPVQPVSDETIAATLPFLSSVVRAMVELQRLTGARPGEICNMRVGEVERTSEGPWVYRPSQHKNSYRGQVRIIYIGPKAQTVLKPFLRTLDAGAFVFSPADAMEELRQQRAEARVTPLHYGNRPGTNIVRNPRKRPGDVYDVSSYRRAIRRAADAADRWAKGGRIVDDGERLVPVWKPHEARHTAATEIRRAFGLEAAQTVLGHATIAASQIYAAKNNKLAREIASKIG